MADNGNNSGGVQKAAAPLLCSQGCGFYGSSSTLNMCSKCFRQHQKAPHHQQDQLPQLAVAAEAAVVDLSKIMAAEGVAAAAAAAAAATTTTTTISASSVLPELIQAPSPASSSLASATPAPAVTLATPLPTPVSPLLSVAATTSNPVASSSSDPSPITLESSLAAPSSELSNDTAETTTDSLDKTDEEHGKKKVQKNKGRCFECRKKIGLTGFACRCGFVYCGEHRYADKHGCDFDYKAHGKDLIIKANPQVVAAKLEKI